MGLEPAECGPRMESRGSLARHSPGSGPHVPDRSLGPSSHEPAKDVGGEHNPPRVSQDDSVVPRGKAAHFLDRPAVENEYSPLGNEISRHG